VSTYADRVNELLRTLTVPQLIDAARTIEANCTLYHYAGEQEDEDICALLALMRHALPAPKVYARTVDDGVSVRDYSV
jgi:hypothetical protein